MVPQSDDQMVDAKISAPESTNNAPEINPEVIQPQNDQI